jgi:hypothetical protein
MLTEYFEANKKYPEAQGLLYKDFPGAFVWDASKKIL